MAKHDFYTPEKDLENEKWKPIFGYEQLYEVSTHGRIKSLPRKVWCNCRSRKYRYTQAKIIAPAEKDGYINIVLLDNNHRKRFRVHRLVAFAFIPNPENKPEINHKDFDKSNNHIDNLEWVTGKENYIHAVRGGRNKPPRIKQYKIPQYYTPPSGEQAFDAKTFYRYDLEGNYISEHKGVSEYSRKVTGNRKKICNSILRNHACHGFRYSYQKLDKLPSRKWAKQRNTVPV